jgi:SAM-dependent methyltransferase
MLKNHLSQDHDWASRRLEFVKHQVEWLTGQLAPQSRILDLACGPGFYTQILGGLGHHCVGVDFSPASIEYARQEAAREGLPLEYALNDIRRYDTNQTFDCVMFIFGEFNVFSAADAKAILAKAARMLKPGGLFVLEGHRFEAVRDIGEAPASWWSCQAGEGVLSDDPHLCLQENYWDQASSTATTRYFTLDAATSEIRMFCSSWTGYTLAQYETLLIEAGFQTPRLLTADQWPVGGPFEGVMMTLVCRK